MAKLSKFLFLLSALLLVLAKDGHAFELPQSATSSVTLPYSEVQSWPDKPSPSISGCAIYNNIKNRGYKICTDKCREFDLSDFLASASAYLSNGFCACSNIPEQTTADLVRLCLQSRLLYASYTGRTKWTTQHIYDDHVQCYAYAGCPCGPARYLAWEGVTRFDLRSCKLVKLSILLFGRCSRCTRRVGRGSRKSKIYTCSCPAGW